MVGMTGSNPLTRLNSGQMMPLLGLGVYNMYGKEAEKAVLDAFEIGYRLLDTAAMYNNEKEIGNAVRSSSLPRKEVFITTKVNNIDQGFDSTLRGFDESLKKLQTDYVDLYLIHWPIKGKRKQTWQALEKIFASGKSKSIGVANYLVPFLNELNDYAQITPAVNQVEFSPYLYPASLLDYCKAKNILLQAYSPLVRGLRMNDPRLIKLAKKYGRTTAQIILRWDIELGISTIPKSVKPERLRENFDIFDFHLDQEDIDYMKTFDEKLRVADDPMIFL
jgi:diketogulonate reductase-like aldo/keto reductase